MIARDLYWEIRERLGLADDWWTDVQNYYGVSRREALALGARAPGRRPNLPGSATCSPVSGKTWEEIWNAKPRSSPEEIASFWREVGSWCVFRQLVRHRGRSFRHIARCLPHRAVLLEYGCGIAPVTWWLAQRRRDFIPVLVDVIASEAYNFAQYRLRHVTRGRPSGPYDVAVIYEVMEHLPNPLRAIVRIVNDLGSGGYLFEDFYRHDGDGSPADLDAAARQRPLVYQFLEEHCALVSGLPPTYPEGGGRRCWRKR